MTAEQEAAYLLARSILGRRINLATQSSEVQNYYRQYSSKYYQTYTKSSIPGLTEAISQVQGETNPDFSSLPRAQPIKNQISSESNVQIAERTIRSLESKGLKLSEQAKQNIRNIYGSGGVSQKSIEAVNRAAAQGRLSQAPKIEVTGKRPTPITKIPSSPADPTSEPFYYTTQSGAMLGEGRGLQYFQTDEEGNLIKRFSDEEVKTLGLKPTPTGVLQARTPEDLSRREQINQFIQEQRSEPANFDDLSGFKQTGINLGLGAASAGLDFYDLLKGFTSDPLGTVKGVGVGIAQTYQDVRSGSFAQRLRQEPAYYTGYFAGQYGVFKGAGKVTSFGISQAQRTLALNQVTLDVAKASLGRGKTRTPLSSTFADTSIPLARQIALKKYTTPKSYSEPITFQVDTFPLRQQLNRFRTGADIVKIDKLGQPRIVQTPKVKKAYNPLDVKVDFDISKIRNQINRLGTGADVFKIGKTGEAKIGKAKKVKGIYDPTKLKVDFDLSSLRQELNRLRTGADTLTLDKNLKVKTSEFKPRTRRKPRGKPLFEKQAKPSVQFIDLEDVSEVSFPRGQKGTQQVLLAPQKLQPIKEKVVTYVIPKEQQKVKSRLVPSYRFDEKQRQAISQIYKSEPMQRAIQTFAQPSLSLSVVGLKSGQRQRFGQSQQVLVSQAQPSRLAQPPIFAQPSRFKQPTVQKIFQGQKYKTPSIPIPRQTFKRPPVRLSLKNLTPKLSGKSYVVSVRKKGKFVPVYQTGDIMKAFQVGKEITGRTIYRSFKVTSPRGAVPLRVPKGYRRAKREPNVLVELSKTSLSQIGEQRVVQSGRRTKRKRR